MIPSSMIYSKQVAILETCFSEVRERAEALCANVGSCTEPVHTHRLKRLLACFAKHGITHAALHADFALASRAQRRRKR
jgi:hypothetical protein